MVAEKGFRHEQEAESEYEHETEHKHEYEQEHDELEYIGMGHGADESVRVAWAAMRDLGKITRSCATHQDIVQ